MKLISFAASGRTSYGAVLGDGVVDFGRRLGDRYPTLRAAIAGWGSGPTVLLCHGFGHARNSAKIRQPQRCACHGERRLRTGHSTWARPTGFAVDSPLEESGFEPSVPRKEPHGNAFKRRMFSTRVRRRA
jgi:hypothetical protein